jgi:hypothetical protein
MQHFEISSFLDGRAWGIRSDPEQGISIFIEDYSEDGTRRVMQAGTSLEAIESILSKAKGFRS